MNCLMGKKLLCDYFWCHSNVAKWLENYVTMWKITAFVENQVLSCSTPMKLSIRCSMWLHNSHFLVSITSCIWNNIGKLLRHYFVWKLSILNFLSTVQWSKGKIKTFVTLYPWSFLTFQFFQLYIKNTDCLF